MFPQISPQHVLISSSDYIGTTVRSKCLRSDGILRFLGPYLHVNSVIKAKRGGIPNMAERLKFMQVFQGFYF